MLEAVLLSKGYQMYMSTNVLKRQTVRGIIWRTAETAGTQTMQFVISIILARLILPEQFAAVAMLSIFIAIAGDLISSGFPNALIRKIDRTQVDCCTVFYFNIIISIVIYLVLYLAAPWIAKFYNLPELISILRVAALSLVIGSTGRIHNILLTIDMDFKTITKLNLAATFISGICGIILAYMDFQVWALVFQSLISSFIGVGLIWIKSSWRPSWMFSWESLKEFFNYGSKLLATSLLSTAFVNMYGVVIGKIFKPSDLAYYNRSVGVSNLVSSTPTSVLMTVTFPVMCKLQGNVGELRAKYRKLISLSAFIVFPLCMIVGSLAYPLINVLYTKIWISAAVLLQILSFSVMLRPIHAINLNLLQVIGRSDIFFRLEVLKKIIAVITLIITIPFGLQVMCYGEVMVAFISLFINTQYTGKYLGFGFIDQLKDIYPSFVLSMILFMLCKYLSANLGNGIESLLISGIAGVVFYIICAFVFRFKELSTLKEIILEEIGRAEK